MPQKKICIGAQRAEVKWGSYGGRETGEVSEKVGIELSQKR